MDEPSGTKSNKSFWKTNWIGLSLVGVMSVFIAVMFFMMTGPNQTPRETALEAVILTASSILASLLITKIYAEMTYNQSLRDHGVQIASGIMVLKRQMEVLTDWIGQKRAAISDHQYTGTDTAEAVLEHVEQTLLGFRGMTDTALSGIAGVIGDALAQYEAVMEQVSTVRAEAFQKTSRIQQEMQTAASSEEVAALQTQIRELEIQTEKQIKTLSRSSALPIPSPPPKRSYTGTCPYCHVNNVIEMLDRQGETQVTSCDVCGGAFNAHISSGQTIVTRPLSGLKTFALLGSESQTPRDYLIQSDLWIDASELKTLISLVLEAEAKLETGDGVAKTPYNLQSLIFSDVQGLSEKHISRKTVRRFLMLIYHGRGFRFAPGYRTIFKSPYVNELTDDSLMTAYVNASIFKLGMWRETILEQTADLQTLLLGDQVADGEKLVETAVIIAKNHLVQAQKAPFFTKKGQLFP